jgi:CHAT domain-containing protein/Tfp pilus assembly protein PilF
MLLNFIARVVKLGRRLISSERLSNFRRLLCPFKLSGPDENRSPFEPSARDAHMSSPILNNLHRSPKLFLDLTRRCHLMSLSSCLILISASLLVWGAPRKVVAQAASAQAQPLEREIAGSEIHSYAVTLAPGQFIRAVFDQRGVDVVVTLRASDGQELQRVDNPAVGSWGPEPLFFEVESAGRYFIQVRPRSPSAAPGRYIVAFEFRRVTVRDKTAFPAERAFTEATRLLSTSAGNRQSGIEKYEEALRLFRAADDWRGEVITLTTIASIHASLGDEQRAFPFFDEALRLQAANGDEKGAAFTRSEIARAYLSLGDRERALEYLEEARRRFLSADDKRMAAYTFINSGTVHDSMGEKKEALANYEQALPLFREAGDRQGEASTLNNIGLVYDALGEKKKAHSYYTQALALFRDTKQCYALAPALSNVAFESLDAGDKVKALEYLNQALALQRSNLDRAGEARTLNNIGFVYNSLGNQQKALDYLGHSLSLNHEINNREGEGDAFSNLMFTWRAGNKPQVAIFYGKQAINAYQEIRRQKASLDKEAQRSFIKSRENTYQQLADLLIARNRLLEAQQVLGLLKEEEYFQYVRRDGRDASGLNGRAAMNAVESDFERRYSEISEALPRLAHRRGELEAKKPNLTADEALQLDKINADLGVADQVFQKFVDQMANELPNAQRSEESVIPGEDTQGILDDLKQLGPSVAAVYTSIGDEKYRIIVFTKDIKAGREYPVKSADLYKKIFAFRQALEDPRSDPRPLAQELYRILVKPIAGILKDAQVETVMWSLTGPLRYIPIAALHDGEKYLVERYRNTVFTPVSTSHLTDTSNDKWKGLGVGVSKAQGQFPALPDVPQELHNIFGDEALTPDVRGVIAGKVFLDESFTEETFFSQLRQKYSVVHIASHFQFQPGNVANSFLLLGNGQELSLARIKGTPNIFGGVDLLALSACETATTGVDADGKEVEGFAVMAQQRGAKSVLASLWPVADKSTPLLMENFYRIRNAKPGTLKAEALRGAQLALIRDNPSFSHPYYWAPFILIGNWR